jgi:hypothetical protein
VVRNGYHDPREVSTATGAVPVRQPRVNDKSQRRGDRAAARVGDPGGVGPQVAAGGRGAAAAVPAQPVQLIDRMTDARNPIGDVLDRFDLQIETDGSGGPVQQRSTTASPLLNACGIVSSSTGPCSNGAADASARNSGRRLKNRTRLDRRATTRPHLQVTDGQCRSRQCAVPHVDGPRCTVQDYFQAGHASSIPRHPWATIGPRARSVRSPQRMRANSILPEI